MRRFFCCIFIVLIVLLAAASVSLAGPLPLDFVFEAVEGFRAEGFTHSAEFVEAGPWLSAVIMKEGHFEGFGHGVEWIGLVFDLETGDRITWDDLFADGDAAAEAIEGIASASSFRNAYSEHDAISPVPRDNFAVSGDTLTVYYPVDQLSHFSGRCGAFSFYAYELSGLLKEDIPLHGGDPASAKEALAAALAAKALPGPLSKWAIGGAMIDAKNELTLVDVPDFSYDYAIYRFEAPEMRGVSLLSNPDEDNAETATIAGIMAERIDFSGLCTGVSSREDCVAALGNPDGTEFVNESDAYSRLPVGETLRWLGGGVALEMHFVQDVLHSVTIRLI